MEYLKNLFEKKNRGQLILAILLIIYLIMGTKVPYMLSSYINNPIAKKAYEEIVLILIAIPLSNMGL